MFSCKFKILAFYESDLHFKNIRNFLNKYKLSQEMEWIVTNTEMSGQLNYAEYKNFYEKNVLETLFYWSAL